MSNIYYSKSKEAYISLITSIVIVLITYRSNIIDYRNYIVVLVYNRIDIKDIAMIASTSSIIKLAYIIVVIRYILIICENLVDRDSK